MTMPGIPVVFAGDEFGLVGDDGEHSRTPMPWSEVDAAALTIDLYSDLIHLRTGHPALNGGGMRWLHVGREVLVFIRETAEESILVIAARGAYDTSLPAYAFAGIPRSLYGNATVERGGAGIRLWGSGPSFSAFALPGVALPDFALPDFAATGTARELTP